MDSRLQLRVQRYGWDRAAAHYEQWWSEQLRPAQECLLELSALRENEHVLELACGTGLVTIPAARAVGSRGRVTATDISDVMIEQVRTSCAGLGLHQVKAQRADAETFPFDDASFDAVICALGLMYVPNPPATLAGSMRVLRSGGCMVSAVWGDRRHCGWAEIFPIVDARVSSEVCPLFFQLGTGGALTIQMELAGFTNIVAKTIDTVLQYDSAEAALGAAFIGGPVAMAYSRFDEATRDEVHAEYLASIEPFRHGTSYSIPGEFIIVRGDKP